VETRDFFLSMVVFIFYRETRQRLRSPYETATFDLLAKFSSQIGATKMFDTQVRYPDVQVRLVGEDGNAFAIMARVSSALKEAGVPQAEIDAYYAESTSGDYDHLLQTAVRWVQVA
jgi:hypothetical protein